MKASASIILVFSLFCSFSAISAIPIRMDCPTDFFTNVASRLIKSELNLDLNNLQVYPTNFYTPSVHRLLQLAANLYDCTTNRTLGITPEEPYCPSVFRPLFRRINVGTNAIVVIANYREVTDTQLAPDGRMAPVIWDLTHSNALTAFPLYGTAYGWPEKNEPLVAGIPLVIGARKGFPNFNEFSMETQIRISRLLEFQRDLPTSRIIATNQMYVLAISNAFGLEAWNSYLTNYPRELRLVTSVSMTAVLTNETGAAGVIFSNRWLQGTSTLIPSNSWSGWTTLPSVRASMVLPFGTTNFLFLTNSTYVTQPPFFVPQTHIFSRDAGFYVPHWWLNLSTKLLFVLVDTAANRIVDYVNLDHAENPVDITYVLASRASPNPADYANPANQWLTNRFDGSTSLSAPTYGIINQIQVGLNGTYDWLNFSQDPYAGVDMARAVDSFRFNLNGLGPIYPQDVGRTFYKSNVFYAPFDPVGTLYVHTSWQANDPLVHYTIGDLLDPMTFVETNRVTTISFGTRNIGSMNGRYRPWRSGTAAAPDPTTDLDISVKDPNINRSDDWNFPTNKLLNLSWVGRVHRGTPWQTIFLKSTNFLLKGSQPSTGIINWARWTGNTTVWPGWDHSETPVLDAFFTAPTNDWHLVSLLNNFFNTNAPQVLASPNLATLLTWESLLDGIVVFTNSSPGQLTPVSISSNSPQAAIVAAALLNTRTSAPQHRFNEIGDVLTTPELSVLSPFIYTPTDEAFEAIPAQLLGRLRPDSIGSALSSARSPVVQFTGIEGCSYLVQSSSDLLNWTTISTNLPQNGLFSLSPDPASTPQFYRSVLQP